MDNWIKSWIAANVNIHDSISFHDNEHVDFIGVLKPVHGISRQHGQEYFRILKVFSKPNTQNETSVPALLVEGFNKLNEKVTFKVVIYNLRGIKLVAKTSLGLEITEAPVIRP